MHDQSIALCQCGCGRPAPLAPKTSARNGWVKGQPLRFIRGHVGREIRPLADRFWERVEKTPTCWLWTGRPAADGYGQIGEGKRTGRHLRAHRVSWEMVHGPLPEGMAVLHQCDTPLCVNPAHLFIGTRIDNNRDMTSKGRQAKGADKPHTKLNPEAVRAIRAAAAAGESQSSLARRFGVHQGTIWPILAGRTWKHVPD